MSWKRCLGLAVVCALLMGCWPGTALAANYNAAEICDNEDSVAGVVFRSGDELIENNGATIYTIYKDIDGNEVVKGKTGYGSAIIRSAFVDGENCEKWAIIKAYAGRDGNVIQHIRIELAPTYAVSDSEGFYCLDKDSYRFHTKWASNTNDTAPNKRRKVKFTGEVVSEDKDTVLIRISDGIIIAAVRSEGALWNVEVNAHIEGKGTVSSMKAYQDAEILSINCTELNLINEANDINEAENKDTVSKLDNVSETEGKYATLHEGDNKKEVLKMKIRMQELGYFRDGASLTESYNAICVERVQMFQKQNGLEATGIADEEMLALLYSGEAVAKDGSKKGPVAVTSENEKSAVGNAIQNNSNPTSAPAGGLIAFEDTDYDVTMNKTLKLKVVKQKIEGSVTYTWSSDNESVVTVNNGTVKGIAGGNATITCIAEDKKGNTYRAECGIRVIVPIKSIKADVAKIELAEQPWRAGSVPEGVTPCYSYKPTLTIEPIDATIQTLTWSSSKESVATVAEDGTITGVGHGTATITGKATDGSGKKVQITVTVPKCFLTAKEVTITEPKSVYVGYAFASIGGISAYDWKTSSKAFALESHYSTMDEGVPTDYAYMGSDMYYMEIIPLKAGTGTITFTRNGSTIGTLNVKVEHSAVYDDVSYPKVKLGTLLKNKTETGLKTQFICKVIQVLEKEGDREPIAYGYVEENGERLYIAFEYATTDTIAVDEMKTVYGTVDHYETYTLETGLQYDCAYMKQTHIE